MIEDSGIADLTIKEKNILEIVKEKWPISALEIAEQFNENISILWTLDSGRVPNY